MKAKRQAFVASFEDELDSETIDNLFEEASEGGAELIESFDDHAKVLFSVPTMIEEVENYEPKEYWKDVLTEILNSCCDPETYSNPIGVYSVYTLSEFIANDKENNAGEQNYSFLNDFDEFADV